MQGASIGEGPLIYDALTTVGRTEVERLRYARMCLAVTSIPSENIDILSGLRS
jgi:hypothetical protein